MPLDPRDPAYLWDMINVARALSASLKDVSLDKYSEDEDLRLTVERRLEIIGEAARRVSESFRSEHPGIPWRRIIGQRNFLSHQYDEIDNERIWRLVKEQIPPLIEQLEPLLPPLPPENK